MSTTPDAAFLCEEAAECKRSFDQELRQSYALDMRALEFTTELGQQPVITIPQDVAAQLPKTGHVRIVILTSVDPEDANWQAGAYEQFMRDDPPEDAVYDDFQ